MQQITFFLRSRANYEFDIARMRKNGKVILRLVNAATMVGVI